MLVERASKSLRPIITSLFSELTVLGFLGLVTFLIIKSNVLPRLSVELFCDGDCYRVCRIEENPIVCVREKMGELQELFESIHMSLFLVMVLFIVLGLINLKISSGTFKKWQEWEKLCIDDFDDNEKIINEIVVEAEQLHCNKWYFHPYERYLLKIQKSQSKH